jgi:hypothetical protein
MLEEVALELSHVDFEFRKLVGELRLIFKGGVWEELFEKSLHLRFTGIVKLDMHISTSWAQKCGIKLLPMISSHH